MSLTAINWPDDGLIPVVIQDDDSDAVLMMGFMNVDALQSTRSTGQVHFWSRSRKELWHKGGSSGHVQHVRSISTNCDLNSLLIRVEQIGAVCHDGYATCYYREVMDDGSLAITEDRLFDPRDVYGDGYGLAALTREWWGAYEWLRDHNLTSQSGTSRLLHDDSTSVIGRIQDELAELAGVLDGSHIHTNQHDDAVLEASQCYYWIVIESLKTGLTWDDVRPDRALDIIEKSMSAETGSTMLRSAAASLETVNAGVASHLLRLIAESVRALDINPRELIEHDMSDLKELSYLEAYFAR